MSASNNGSIIVSNVIWKFAERIMAQLVSLVVSIVLARLLFPEEYGLISMVMVFITIANVFVTSGIPNGLIYKKDADSLDFSSIFYFNLLLSIILYLIIFCCAPLIASIYENESMIPIIRVLGLRIIVASVNSVQHAYVSRKMMFKKYFWSTLFGTLLSGIIGIIMAYNGFGVWALVAQYMINTTVDTIILFVTVKWYPKLEFSWARVKFIFKYGWKILFEAISETLTTQIRSLIIGKVYSSSELAYYDKGNQFPSLIVGNIGVSIGSVLFPAMSAEQDDGARVKEMLRQSVRVSSYVIFPMLTGLAVIAPIFVSVILTDKWVLCIPYLQLFCLIHAFTVGMIPRHQALLGTGKSHVYMIEHIFSRVISIILLLCLYKISVMAITISVVISSLIMSLTVMFTSKHYNKYNYKEQIIDVIPTIIGCTLMGIAVFAASYIPVSKVLLLAIQVVIGIIVYISYSAVFKVPEFNFVIRFIKSIFLHKKEEIK